MSDEEQSQNENKETQGKNKRKEVYVEPIHVGDERGNYRRHLLDTCE
ncbi:hypothetical protein [Methanohalobium sp.]|nr:hypothetical protein [Methanohalobium sp.]